MDGSISKGMLGQLMGAQGAMSGEQMKQAENIWKMLDDLSESNPEGYQSFIKNNLENGMTEMKKEQEKKTQALKVAPQPTFLLKALANISSVQIKQEESPLYKSLNIMRTQTSKIEELKKSLDKEVRVYINVLGSERVRTPLDVKGVEIPVTDLKRMDQWSVIPYSVQDATSRKSNSLGRMVYFFDFVINSQVLAIMSGAPPLVEQLVTFISEKMNNCMKQHRNPILKMYDYMSSGEILFYTLERMSIVRHKSKKFKLPDASVKQFPMVLLEPEADKEVDLNKMREMHMKRKQDIEQNGELAGNLGMPGTATGPSAKKKDIKDVNDLKSQQAELEKEEQSKIEESVLDGLRIVQKSEKEKKEEAAQNQTKKKVLIQEIEPTPLEVPSSNRFVEFKPKGTTVVAPPTPLLEKPWYEMKELTASLQIEILLTKASTIQEMILDVSDNKLHLVVPLVYELDIVLPFKILTESVAPKWSKKTKLLKLALFKANS